MTSFKTKGLKGRIIKTRSLLLFISLILLGSCSMNYSFTGASIPAEVKTINIKYFPNNASLIEPTLSQKLTDALRDKFASETNLVLVNEGGDLVLEGSITQYRTTPVAIQGNDKAALNRLTIAVDVTYTNTKDEAASFESPPAFTRYDDYASDSQLSTVQDELIDSIIEMLVVDIFNKAVVNW